MKYKVGDRFRFGIGSITIIEITRLGNYHCLARDYREGRIDHYLLREKTLDRLPPEEVR